MEEKVKQAIVNFVIKTLEKENAHPQELAIVPALVKTLQETPDV